MGIVPAQIAHQIPGIGVNQQLVMIKAMTIFRIVRPVDPIAIQSAGFQIRYIAVPDLVGIFRQLQTGNLGVAARIIQT
ncbi:hypothetical protein D3C79_1075500 [compost metagenome]